MQRQTQITLASVAAEVAGRVNLSGLVLPRPNIYWVTVQFFSGSTHQLYMAADHTTSLVRKVSNYGAQNYGIRPMKGNCLIRSKRLDAIDLVNNPGAWESARKIAAANNERDVIDGLDHIPHLILNHATGSCPIDNRGAADLLWQRVAEELERTQAPVRVLR